MPLALIALLIHYQDEMLLLVIVFLSIVLSLVDIGFHWEIDFLTSAVANPMEIIHPAILSFTTLTGLSK
jgi:hypothetical protein